MVVGQADVLPLARLQLFREELLGELAHNQQAFAPLAAGQHFGGFFLLHNLYIIALRDVTQRLDVRTVLVLHKEPHGRAGLPASEALVDTLRRRHIERRRLLLMERTAGHIVGPAALQRHEVSHYVLNPYGIQDEVYCLLRYHLTIRHSSGLHKLDRSHTYLHLFPKIMHSRGKS